MKLVKESLVKEALSDVLKPRGADEILSEIQRRLQLVEHELMKEGPGYKVYLIGAGPEKEQNGLKTLVSKGYYGSSDIFSNYYFVIDENNQGPDIGIGVEVDLKKNVKAYNIKGDVVDKDILEKYSEE